MTRPRIEPRSPRPLCIHTDKGEINETYWGVGYIYIYIYIYIYRERERERERGAHGVMVIVVGSGHDASSNPG